MRETKTNSPVIGPLGRAIAAGDGEYVAAWLRRRFGVAVGGPVVLTASAMTRGWSDGSWWSWFRNRIVDDGWYEWAEPLGDPPAGINLPVTLHTGYLSVVVTPEQAERGRVYDGSVVTPEGPDTPGIERTTRRLTPVDRTAARVTGVKQ